VTPECRDQRVTPECRDQRVTPCGSGAHPATSRAPIKASVQPVNVSLAKAFDMLIRNYADGAKRDGKGVLTRNSNFVSVRYEFCRPAKIDALKFLSGDTKFRRTT
jgi:hypothetical protein